MGDLSRKIDVMTVIAVSDDFVGVLRDEKDVNNLTQHLEQSKALQSQCDADYNDVLSLLQDYQKRIDVSKKKSDEARSEAASDAEMDLFQQELEEDFHRERLLQEELIITNEISDLENQRASVEERREILRKLEQDEMRAQMKLSIIGLQREKMKVEATAVNRADTIQRQGSHPPPKAEKMVLEITQFLLSAQSADAKVRTEAEGNLRQFQEQNLPSFFLSLSVELSNNDKPIESRRLAGVLLKNSLDAKDASRKEHLVQQWVTIDISVKSKIKDLLLNTLGSLAPEARHTSSQVIAKIAAIEIPRKEWPELIGSLLEISDQDLVQDEVNSVLTAVVQGMNVAQHSPEVRLAATRLKEMKRLALQAIEFWSSICDEEIEFQEYETAESVPMLLETLLKQKEDQDQDDGIWNVSMSGGTCLGLVARTVGDAIVPLVMPFVEANILKTDWRSREAATYAFGSILEGPSVEKLAPMVHAGLDFLLNAMKDESSHVKDTTAWTLSRVLELLHTPSTGFSVISPANLQRVLGVLLESIKDAPHVAEKVCGAIYYLAQGYEDAGASSSLLTPYLPDIITCLIATAGRTDGGDSKLRSAAYETLNEVVRCSNLTETSHIITQLLPVIINKLGQTVELQIVSSDDREKQGDLQALLCGVLQVIIQKLSSTDETKAVILQASDQIISYACYWCISLCHWTRVWKVYVRVL
ncbi:unnamed protein product [Camellia sinensis]